jgi:prepilin-type N-terminal cleavage/methylation domain-containing protein
MKKLNENGMTLIEVIIAMAILGIMVVSFLAVFTNSFSIIFNHGRKSSSLMAANSIMDKIYESSIGSGCTDIDDVKTMIVGVMEPDYHSKYEFSSTLSEISTAVGSEAIRIYVGPAVKENLSDPDSIEYFPVTILVFQTNRSMHVTLTASIPKGGNV